MRNTETVVQSFRAYVSRMVDYQSALALLEWDARTQMPKKGMLGRSSAIGTLSAELFRMRTSDQMADYLKELALVTEELDRTTKRMVAECKKEYDRQVKIPADRYEALTVLVSQAEAVWQVAREQSDFLMFVPYLQKIVDLKREFIGYWGYEGHPYNALLDAFEPGITVQILDELFHSLRNQTVNLLNQIQAAQPVNDQILHKTYTPAKQQAFCFFLLRQMGYDLEAGRLDETAHPFETSIAPGDIRVTTRFIEHFLNSALFGALHEGGHALYEQNIASELIGTNLHEGTSMGIHESQSRFWENIIGRSYEFWERYFGDLQQTFPDELGDVDLVDFYAAVNAVQPSLIRVEADELTYNLHIMIRYELEKQLISGELQVVDLPVAWSTMTKDYLGIEPDNDAHGVLQDIHWAGGDFGYFPSYTLGNIYSAQIAHALERDMPDFRERVRNGQLTDIRDWLVERIYQHGKLVTPSEVIQSVTGEPANEAYLVQYLRDKYMPLYNL